MKKISSANQESISLGQDQEEKGTPKEHPFVKFINTLKNIKIGKKKEEPPKEQQKVLSGELGYS